MENKDSAVIKALAELGLRKEPQLSPEQEKMLQSALDPNEAFYDAVLKIFDVDLTTDPPTVG